MLHEMLEFETLPRIRPGRTVVRERKNRCDICLVSFCWLCIFASTSFVLLIRTTYEASNLWYPWCDCAFWRFRHITLVGFSFDLFFFWNWGPFNITSSCPSINGLHAKNQKKSYSIFQHNNVTNPMPISMCFLNLTKKNPLFFFHAMDEC